MYITVLGVYSKIEIGEKDRIMEECSIANVDILVVRLELLNKLRVNTKAVVRKASLELPEEKRKVT